MAKSIMIQGTMSNVGKSLLAAGLCRIFKQDGYRVAPFKSQNMALNSYITSEGLEMGRAQVMQAEAAGIEPSVLMNPILLKPTNDVGSQVIVNGEVLATMRARDYFKYKKTLIPDIMKAYHTLEEQSDIIVIEGAGSPAEINLKSDDIVNMGMAKMAKSPVLLVGDIDRGGVFAQLAGTMMLLEEEEKQLVKGLIINKFRGDKTILDPGIVMLEELCHRSVVGVTPYMDIDVEDEDSLSERMSNEKAVGQIDLVVVRLPRISNFTDFNIFESIPGVSVRYVKRAAQLGNPDLILLPGTKNTMSDLAWMRQSGMEAAVLKAHTAGCPIFGICGGYQMLGEELSDPFGVEDGGTMRGMGLLPMHTVFTEEKTRTRVNGQFLQVKGDLAGLSGIAFSGYEIHMGDTTLLDEGKPLTEAYTGDGIIVNSGDWNGMKAFDAKKKIPHLMEEKGWGRKTTNYKLRDWVFSRQRYWGEPIPIVHCEKCGYVPLDESELPLLLPEVDSYMPTDNGESPLAAMTEWVNTTCPCCGGPAKRETDTMPQWAGSSWYYLRYTDPHNDKALASPEALKYWLPVDWYNGGMEHTTLHLLYSRFWHKFLYDQGVVPTPEPYQKRTSHGMILGSNGEKMSKSRGNVVNPDDIVQDYGADTLRTYEMFIGAFDLSASWSEEGVKGCRRFLERVWKLQDILTSEEGYSADLETKMHQTIKKVSSDFENLKYNTAIAAMMSLINEFYKKNSITRGEYKTLLTLLNPVAPHITEELWQTAGFEGRLYQAAWPEYEEEKTVESVVEIGVQVNGRMRVTINVSKDETKENVIAMAKEALGDKLTGNIVKEIYVPGRIVNIVAK